MATLVAMTVDGSMALKDVKNHLSEVVDQVEREHDRVVITKHGRPVARLVPAPLHARRQVPDRVPPTPEEHAEFMRRHQERAARFQANGWSLEPEEAVALVREHRDRG